MKAQTFAKNVTEIDTQQFCDAFYNRLELKPIAAQNCEKGIKWPNKQKRKKCKKLSKKKRQSLHWTYRKYAVLDICVCKLMWDKKKWLCISNKYIDV